MKTDIKSLTLKELKTELEKMGEKPFRAGQIYGWLHGKTARSFEEMTDLSKPFRKRLEETFELTALEAVRTQVSRLDGTRKYLFRLSDGNRVESVWMKYRYGASVCISSQAGCRMGCRFCASTLGGLERSLSASEMLDQVYAVGRLTGGRISHVVVMGIGEPLDNYEQLVRFIRLLTDENGQRLSQRNLTVSTCGIVPGIYRLADEGLQITLALSLHAVTDEKRRALMPIAETYPLEEVLKACRYYFERTGRRLTFEYALAENVNDGEEDARLLSGIANRMHAHVNLIPVNPVRERGFFASGRQSVRAFQEILEKNHVAVTLRRELGRDIDGACGQLRGRHREEKGRTS